MTPAARELGVSGEAPDEGSIHPEIWGPAPRGMIPPFMVMDVVARANRLAAEGRDILHLEVGQPGAGAPDVAITAARARLGSDRLGYTDTTRAEAYALADALKKNRRAALICFEWLQRPENVLTGKITWADYRSAEQSQPRPHISPQGG